MDEQHKKVWKSTTHLLMDSGAPITRRSARASEHNRAKKYRGRKFKATGCIFWAYTRKFLAIASGATPIGSTGHAPDDNGYRWRKITSVINYLSSMVIFDFMSTKYKLITPIGSHSKVIWRTTRIFCTFQQSNKACNKKSKKSSG
jgi:hypothetical protein